MPTLRSENRIDTNPQGKEDKQFKFSLKITEKFPPKQPLLITPSVPVSTFSQPPKPKETLGHLCVLLLSYLPDLSPKFTPEITQAQDTELPFSLLYCLLALSPLLPNQLKGDANNNTLVSISCGFPQPESSASS